MPESEKPPAGGRLRDAAQASFNLVLGAATWGVERGDRLIRQWTARGQVSREKGKRMVGELRAQVQRNREELGKIVAGRVRNAAASTPFATREQVESLERRIEDLSRKLDAIEKRRKRSPS